MEEIGIFVQTVRKHGRITIPEPYRIAKDIQPDKTFFFAMSTRPFKAIPVDSID